MRLRSPVFLIALVAALAACGSDEVGFPDLAEPTYLSVDAVVADLRSRPLADFYDLSFRYLLQRSPESVTDLGLSATYGQRDNYLDTVSDDFLVETYDLVDAIRALLVRYDPAALTPAERVTYDAYAWYLDDLARERPFMHHSYAINSSLTSEHQKLLGLFTQVHPLATRANAEDYVERLWRVKQRVEQVIEGVKARRREGLVPPLIAVQGALETINSIATASPTEVPFYTSFADRLASAAGVDPSTRDSLLREAGAAIEQSVQPAFGALYAAVNDTLAEASTGPGVWALPNGGAYYAHVLRHHTTTALSAADVHTYGLAEVARIRAEIQTRLGALGYPEGETLAQSFARVARDGGGQVAASECIARYNAIARDAQTRLSAAIDIAPRTPVEVRADPIGGYYTPGASDGSRPGVFYAYVPAGGVPAYSMRTLTYHETVPGHHTQIAIARELPGLPVFRAAVTFTAQAEGWALYAERLAYELGWYADDPYGDLGRLQYELLRAVRLVADTGLHEKRWTYEQAVAYVNENTGFPTSALNVPSEVVRYLCMPGQATAYKIGMRELLAMRARARTAQATAFDLTAFHRAVLTAGNLPLPMLSQLVQAADPRGDQLR
jgi:uncharacterized protein (DUF885 family)